MYHHVPRIWFNAPRREEHAGTRLKSLAFFVQKLFEKKRFLSKTAIWVGGQGVLIPSAQVANVSSSLIACGERTAQELSNDFFQGLPAKIFSVIMAHIRKK